MLIAVSAGLGLILIAISPTRNADTLSWYPVNWLLVLLLIWATASFFWSVDKQSSLLGLTQLASLIILALLATRLSSDAVEKYVLPTTMIAATIVGLIGISQHFGWNPLLLRQLAPPASTFINRNYAANYLDLITPVAFCLLLIQSRPSKPLALLAATAFTASLGFLVISQTRGSWLGLLIVICALAIIYFFHREFRNLFIQAVRCHYLTIILSLTIVCILGFTKSYVGPEGKLEAVLSMTPDVSVNIRLHAYQNALSGFIDSPLKGVGYGAFINGFSPYVDAVHPLTVINQNNVMQYLHSDPLQMFFELGLPGGFLSLAIYTLVILMAWRIIRSNASATKRLIGLGLMLALLASGTHAWVDFPLHLPTSAFYFWLWSGLVIGLYMQIFPKRPFTLPRSSLAMVGIIGLTFTLFSIYLYQGYLRANRDVRSAMIHAHRHECKSVFDLTDKAMNEFGIDHLTRFWFAKVYTYCDTTPSVKMHAMDRILLKNPNMPLPHLTRAWIRLNHGNIEGAITDFNTYRKLLPHRPEGYIGLGEAAIHLKNEAQARYWLQQARIRAPDDMTVQQRLERLNSGEKAQPIHENAD